MHFSRRDFDASPKSWGTSPTSEHPQRLCLHLPGVSAQRPPPASDPLQPVESLPASRGCTSVPSPWTTASLNATPSVAPKHSELTPDYSSICRLDIVFFKTHGFWLGVQRDSCSGLEEKAGVSVSPDQSC